MDFLERLNRRFGTWYEGLFGGGDTDHGELRPKDILRRILAAMEDGRREGLDGQVYVPNAYTLRIAVASDAERDYLRAFLSAEELATAVARTISQHGYKTRGGLLFVIEEADAADPNADRVTVVCRFDATVPNSASVAAPEKAPPAGPPSPINGGGKRSPVNGVSNRTPKQEPPQIPHPFIGDGGMQEPSDEEPGTVPAVFGAGGGPTLATLLVRSGDGRSLEAFPLTQRGAVVGRSRQSGNDIVLTDPQVSKRHGRIVWERGGFVYYDEGSTNGSRVNDLPATAGVAVPLQFGDVVQLGGATLILRPVGSPAAALSPNVPPAPGKGASLIAANGTPHRLASEMVVGRAVTADLTLTGTGVSERHARLKTTDNGKLTLEDLNTPGGTYVNGERIPALFAVALYDGDEVVFGQVPPMKVRIG